MFEWLQQNMATVALIGGGIVLLFGDKLGPIAAKILALLKSASPPKTSPDPSPSPVGGNENPAAVVVHFLAIKHHCKDCPKAQAALKSLWVHLEPGHVVEGGK